MIIATADEYWAEKASFFKKYPVEKIETSSMDEYGSWHKEYICEHNEVWYESYSVAYESKEITVEIKKVPVKTVVEAKLLRTEYWNTIDGFSSVMYEKY